MTRASRVIVIFACASVFAVAWALLAGGAEKDVEFGATFSKPYAEKLGLDWRETYVAMLDDLGVRLLRVPAYWDDIERERGIYDFSNVDWQIEEAARRDAKLILVLGRKLPRWPECHVPTWAAGLHETERQQEAIEMIKAIVKRYADEKAIVSWQVENEPFFRFGECAKISRATVESEVAAIHGLDGRPVLLQDIGEFSSWLKSARIADTLGVSVYRVVWNRFIGYIRWPGAAGWYGLRGALARRYVDKVIITELQAEPWFPDPVADMPIDEQLSLMNPEMLRDNAAFARRIGFPEAYFWGVEWWYWIKKHGHPEIWEAGREIIRESKK